MLWLWITLGALAVVLAVYLFLVAPSFRKCGEFPRGYAHRGLWNEKLPENSIAAFKNAIDNGFAFETDVQLTKDKVPIIHHDETLERMCGKAVKISDLTYKELSEYKLLSTDEKIPTLKEVLDLTDGKVGILLELKGESYNTELCDVIAPIIKAYQGEMVIESFNPLLLKRMRQLLPDMRYGQLVTGIKAKPNMGFAETMRCAVLAGLLTNFISRPDFIAFNEKHARGLGLFITTKIFGTKRCAWTVRTEQNFNRHLKKKTTPIFEGIVPQYKSS